MAELVSMRRHAVGATGDYSIASGASGALSGVSTGAAVGSVIPVVGTVLGAVIGGVLGLLGGFGSDEVVHGPLVLAKRAAVAQGLVPSGATGTALFRDLLLRGDPAATQLFQQSGGSLAKWLPAERARRAKRARTGGMVSPGLTIQPVGPPILLAGAVPLSADVAPPEIAALMAVLQQIIALGR